MTSTVGAPWYPQMYHEGPSHAGGGLLRTGSQQKTCSGGKVGSTMTEPKRLDKYEILEEIGRGGFAVVYRARDTELDRIIALKVLHPYWTADPDFAARFRQEARAAANLRHPNIATVYEAGEAEGQLYIAMEHLPGRTLRELLETGGALSLERALPILEQVAEALDYAHGRGVVHRDVKPGNIIVEETARGVWATLTDFGLVKAMEGSAALTSQGTLLGSPEYMAPEQADPERATEIGPATDRYALGIVAYQMLTGRVPFPGNTPATLNAHEHKPVPPPRSLRPDLSKPVAAALVKMLAKTPADRFASARAFITWLREGQRETQLAPLYEQLQAAAAQEDWTEVLALGGRIQGLAPDHRDVVQRMAQAREQLRRPQRGPMPAWAWVAVGVVVLALLVGLGGLGLGWWPAEEPTGELAVVPTEVPIERPTEMPTEVATATPPKQPIKAPIEAPTEAPIEEPALSLGDTWTRPADQMVMVYVPAGEFEMGNSAEGYDGEQPVHTVALDGFWIDRTEVTNGQYRRCVEAGACDEPGCWDGSLLNDPDQPVVCVDWYQAQAYCEWAWARLPMEAEWEYAARGSEGRVFPWGDEFDGTRLNYCDANCEQDWADETVDDGYAVTAPVRSYPGGASWCNALDMAGNVWEWVADWYGAYPSGRQVNPTGPSSGESRVLRGGSWDNDLSLVRGAMRVWYHPGDTNSGRGFRCARGSEFGWWSGGPAGAAVNAIAFDPVISRTLYVATAGGGLYRSTDGGNWWDDVLIHPDQVLNWGEGHSWVYDVATAEGVVYAATKGSEWFHRSTDGGDTWSHVSGGLGGVVDLTVHPTVTTTLYAAGSGVYISTNAGESWFSSSTGMDPNESIQEIAINPVTPTTIYAASYYGKVYKSADGGASWDNSSSGLPGEQVWSVAVNPVTPTIVYVGLCPQGVWRSNDGGANWFKWGGSDIDPHVREIVVDPADPSTVYVGTDGHGVYRRSEGDIFWTHLGPFYSTRQRRVYAIGVTANAPDTVFAGVWGDGIYKSTNGGQDWEARNVNLSALRINRVAADPNRPGTAYATAIGGLFQTIDGGQTWEHIRDTGTWLYGEAFALTIEDTTSKVYVGMYGSLITTTDGVNWYDASNGLSTACIVWDIAINPVTPTIVYAAQRWGSTDEMGVYRSVDGGSNWVRASSGITDTDVTALAVDPNAPQIVYAGTQQGNLFRSADGGDSWSWSSNGIIIQSGSPAIWDIVPDPRTPGVVYLAHGNDGVSAQGGIYKSTDYGLTWKRVLEGHDPGALVLDPLNPEGLITASWNDYLYRSEDGGETWSVYDADAFTGYRYIQALAVGPSGSGWRLYAGTAMNSIWQRDIYTAPFQRQGQ